MRLLQWIIIVFLLIAIVIAVLSYRNTRSSNSEATVKETNSRPQAPTTEVAAIHQKEEESCRVFVQSFYDWYWNQFADKVENPEFDLRQLYSCNDVLQRRPSVLGPELIRLIKKEEAIMNATGQIGNLDFDPFLNSQDMSGKFLVTNVQVSNGVCRATVKGSSEVRAELKKSESTWIFVNFHYSFYSEDGKTKRFPDDDLIHMLNQ